MLSETFSSVRWIAQYMNIIIAQSCTILHDENIDLSFNLTSDLINALQMLDNEYARTYARLKNTDLEERRSFISYKNMVKGLPRGITLLFKSLNVLSAP
ncbi:MAG: hypothetical protein K2P93_04390 [Alphaproteobacteria bacterium]|nr:hypothetical protein [Alphaproteobacteria bacterium]